MPINAIRRATEKDIPALALVHIQAWQWAYRGLMPDAVLDTLDPERRADSWRRILNDGSLPWPHVAMSGSTVVGFVHADTSRDDDASDSTGEVASLYIAQDYLGTGVGRRLWGAAVEQLRESGHTDLTVWVLDTNRRGRNFYERMGLAPDGATKNQTMNGATLTELRYSSRVTQG